MSSDINSFHATGDFLYPLKTLENLHGQHSTRYAKGRKVIFKLFKKKTWAIVTERYIIDTQIRKSATF